MSCSQTLSAISKDCSPNLGGVKRVLIANQADVSAITITSDEVTAITMVTSGTPPVAKTFLEFTFRPNSASLSSNWQINADNGTAYVQSDLVMAFNRMETSKRVSIQALALSDLYVIVEDMNGKYWLLGYDNPVNLSAGDGLTGQQMADKNGYDVTLTDYSKELPMEVDDSIISSLL